MDNKYLKYKSKYNTLRKNNFKNLMTIDKVLVSPHKEIVNNYSTHQIGGAQKTIVEDGITYQGAGLLIINRHTNSKRETADHVIYFKQTKDNILDLPGGRCEDDHTSLEQTASIELYEESRKSIGIKPEKIKTFNSVTVDGRGGGIPGKFKCYIVRVVDISSNIYNLNKSIFDSLTSMGNPRFRGDPTAQKRETDRLKSFLETSELCRVPVSAIQQLSDGPNNKCTDDEGNSVTVSYQSLRVYKEALAKGILPYSINDNLPSNGILQNAGQSDRSENKSLVYKEPGRILTGITINYN